MYRLQNVILAILVIVFMTASVSIASTGDDLVKAVEESNLILVKKICDEGINVNYSDDAGWTALMVAAENGSIDIVKLLLSKGADVNKPSTDYSTALTNAVNAGHVEITKLLIDSGADINVSNNMGNTPLLIAAEKGYGEIAKLLLDKGAYVMLKNLQGQTAMDCAIENNHDDMQELIQQAMINTPLTKKMWQEDLKYLAKELPKRHKNLFFHIKKAEFENAVERLDKSIPSMNDEEIKVELERLVAMVGDAHTNLPLPWDCRIPLGFYWFENGIYVIASDKDYEKALRCRLTKIGDTSIEKVIELIKPIISHENEAWVKYQIPYYLVRTDILYALKILAEKDNGKFTFEDAKGKVFTMNIQSVPAEQSIAWSLAREINEQPLTLRIVGAIQPYAFRYLEDSKTLYFEYNTCSFPVNPFDNLHNELMRFIANYQVERFVIDLSLNGGGDSRILDPLIDQIKELKQINKKGHLFGIIGKKTFSSGMLNAITLHNKTNIILVGEPTGGKPNCYGDTRSFVLPHSGFEVTYSIKYFGLSSVDTPSFMADIEVHYKSSDYFLGKDPVLETILNYK